MTEDELNQYWIDESERILKKIMALEPKRYPPPPNPYMMDPLSIPIPMRNEEYCPEVNEPCIRENCAKFDRRMGCCTEKSQALYMRDIAEQVHALVVALRDFIRVYNGEVKKGE